MYHLVGLNWSQGRRIEKSITIAKPGTEQLLVAFLNELIFFLEAENLAFDQFDLVLSGITLKARMCGSSVNSVHKEIKAATFHNLVVSQTKHGFRTRIVFDV
jgi:SHS2 domain-containing protein